MRIFCDELIVGSDVILADDVAVRGVGSVYGAFQSYARALYAELIPPGEEARWCVHRPLLGGSLRHVHESCSAYDFFI